jgi:acyl carrier protein
MMNEIEQKVLEIVSEVFNFDLNQLTVNHSRDDIESWDSIGHLQLILRIESELGIKLKTSEIVSIKYINDLVNLVEIYLQNKKC